MAANKRWRHTPDQIIGKLAEGNKLLGAGQELSEVCRHLDGAKFTDHIGDDRCLVEGGDVNPDTVIARDAHQKVTRI